MRVFTPVEGAVPFHRRLQPFDGFVPDHRGEVLVLAHFQHIALVIERVSEVQVVWGNGRGGFAEEQGAETNREIKSV